MSSDIAPSLDSSPLLRGDIGDSRRALSNAAVELWNVRLEALRQAGDIRGLLAHLATAADGGCDNCSCNQGCNSCLEALDAVGRRMR
jgi:hypothetical protein